jgi:hypothetical protein
MNLTELRRDAAAVALKVRKRLEEWGEYEPGCCLMASVIGCAELKMLGYNVALQAGSCFWRRIPETTPDLPEDDTTQNIGFEWSPDTAVSKFMMSMGNMPEFHAWVAVLPSRRGDGIHRDGWIVDFSVHFLPEMIMARHGYPWLAPRPANPFVVSVIDGVAEILKSRNEGRTPQYLYDVDAEACLCCMFMARSLVVRKAREDGLKSVEHLFPAFDGRDTIVNGVELDAIDCLKLVRKYRAENADAWTKIDPAGVA